MLVNDAIRREALDATHPNGDQRLHLGSPRSVVRDVVVLDGLARAHRCGRCCLVDTGLHPKGRHRHRLRLPSRRLVGQAPIKNLTRPASAYPALCALQHEVLSAFEHDLSDALCTVALHVWQHMAVGVQGDRHTRMTEPLPYNPCRHPSLQNHRRVRVSQTVRTDPRQSGTLDVTFERPGDPLRTDHRTVLMGEGETGFHPDRPGSDSLLQLMNSVFPTSINRRRVESNSATCGV